MILRTSRYDVLLLLSLLLPRIAYSATAETTFDCHITVDEHTKFDLTSLSGEHVVNRTRQTPPTSMIDSLRFDLCGELKPQSGVNEHDQCPSGTKACLTKTNMKGDDPGVIISVIPIAQTSNLEPLYKANFSPKSLNIVLHGAEYPSPTDSTPIRQSLNLTVLCDPQSTSDPKFIAYDGSRLDVEWSAAAGCPFEGEGEDGGNKDGEDDSNKDEKPGKDEPTKDNVGSGVGWFFLVILLAFIAYFALGAYYNYATYGASGFDLIPHRDFWKEVPYMLNDVVSHLCSNVRPRRTSSRGGYISV